MGDQDQDHHLDQDHDDHDDENDDMEWRITGVETILNYKFKNKKLLEEALTHPTCICPNTASYQRLEFIGDAVLGMVFSELFFSMYPNLGEDKLTLLKQANTTNERLARVALRHRLYEFLRIPPTTSVSLDQNVQEFALIVEQEEEIQTIVFGGTVKACKVLADIVESVVAAVYFDCGSDLKFLWQVIGDLMEPIVTHETLPTHPVTKLFEMCQKHGKKAVIKTCRDHNTNKYSIYVDNEPFGVGCSDLIAAKEALVKLNLSDMNRDMANLWVDLNENETAMQKLHNLCAQMKWVKPSYRIEKEEGLPHDKKFTCSVEIETEKGKISAWGDEKSRVKEAENSAASSLIRERAKLSSTGTDTRPHTEAGTGTENGNF